MVLFSVDALAYLGPRPLAVGSVTRWLIGRFCTVSDSGRLRSHMRSRIN
jgi:hypothetical protein